LRTGRPGRPRKVISKAYLQEAFSAGRNISANKLAVSLKVHRNTVQNYSNLYKVKSKCRIYSDISNTELDAIVKAYRHQRPHVGSRYLRGYFLQHNLRVQKDRIRASLQRVDGLGQVLQKQETIQRREYKNARPNALWHLDGHHKLILWGIVIHGIVDGYCQTVSAQFNCSTSNNYDDT
jgi:hypothetical protein